MAAIVQNTGTNYTLYYNVLNYFKTIMNNHPSIEQVSQGEIGEIDDIQFPFYPIGNVLVTNSVFGTSVTEFTIQLIVADKIKNKNNESEGERNKQIVPFFGVDDTVDIHANTLAILNDLVSYTQRGVAGFEINGDISCTPFADRFNNGLAGWQAEFTLTTHNDKNRCLFFLTSPSGSGYVIEECRTGETYNAVLNGTITTGSIFSTYYPTPTSCYNVLSELTNFDDWDLVNLPIQQYWDTCEKCNGCYYDTLDIVRNGLIFAYDTYGYTNGSNVLVDKSGYGRNASITGSLNIVSGVAMQFTGDRSTWLQLPSQTSPEIYPAWQWTTQTNLSIPDTLPSSSFMSMARGGGSWRWCIDPSGSTTLPNTLRWLSNLADTSTNVITSSITNTTLTATGTEIYPPIIFNATGSLVKEYFNNDLLPISGTNDIFLRNFNYGASDMTFGKYENVSIGPVSIDFEALTANVRYILYYNRPLTSAEIEQNVEFFQCGKAIKTPTTTTTLAPTTTTTTLAPTTTTTTLAPTTTTTTLASASCPYTVGQLAEGGVIAYILQPGDNGYDANQQKGYVATISDISTGAEWGCEGTNVPFANFLSLGTGVTNTAAILAACATPGIAARLCADLVEGGYSDWYLPSLEELRKLCQNKFTIGGFDNTGFYWCSSQQSPGTRALVQAFVNCTTVTTFKSELRRVRAIRSFACPATPTTSTTSTTTTSTSTTSTTTTTTLAP